MTAQDRCEGIAAGIEHGDPELARIAAGGAGDQAERRMVVIAEGGGDGGADRRI